MGFYTYKSKEDWMQKNGFNKEGVTYVITGGNTFEIKEALKSAGCKFSSLLKWHSPERIVLNGFKFVSFTAFFLILFFSFFTLNLSLL